MGIDLGLFSHEDEVESVPAPSGAVNILPGTTLYRRVSSTDMPGQKLMVTEFPWNDRYRLSDVEDVLTPALVIYPEIVASNISSTLTLLGGNHDRWRPHIKTSKLEYTLRMMVAQGVRNFKCATTLELLSACRSGADDVLVAYPLMGANARRTREIALEYPHVRISVLVEDTDQLRQWTGSRIGIFLDINPGMNRTGIEQTRIDTVIGLIRECSELGLNFCGLHYYDGQYGGLEIHERTISAHAGYDLLLQLIRKIEQERLAVREVVTAGTPALSCSLSYEGFRGKDFVHRVSPGTVVYGDATSLAELPSSYGYQPAVLVLSRIASEPRQGILTCDAGHKTVSADSGIPTCVVIGHSELEPLSPSEEHLPLKVKGEARDLRRGSTILLLPRHICPTVNNFDAALLVRKGEIESVERVSGRGREMPLAHKLSPLQS